MIATSCLAGTACPCCSRLPSQLLLTNKLRQQLQLPPAQPHRRGPMPDRQLPSRPGRYHGWPLDRSRQFQSLATCQLQWKAGTRRWRERRRTGRTVQKTTRLRMARLWSPPVGERCSFCEAPRPAECHPPEPNCEQT